MFVAALAAAEEKELGEESRAADPEVGVLNPGVKDGVGLRVSLEQVGHEGNDEAVEECPALGLTHKFFDKGQVFWGKLVGLEI